MDDADLELAAQGIVWGAFGTSGQRCTATSRVIVHEKVKEDLEKHILEEMKNLKIGDGLNDDIKVGPIINQGGIDKIKKYIEIGKEKASYLLAEVN